MNFAVKWILSGAALLIAAAPVLAASGTVTAVQSGDTFTLDHRIAVRVFGIEAPELAQHCRADAIHAPGPSPCVPCGVAAREALAALILGRDVVCTERGKAGDAVRGECTVGKIMVGPSMLTQGQAVADRGVLTADTRALYIGAEASGKRANAGLWAQTFIPPAAWRTGQRLACERPAAAP